MQGTKISKRLEAVIARAAFNATRLDLNIKVEDQLFVEILSDRGSLAYQSVMNYIDMLAIEELRERAVKRIATGIYNDIDDSFEQIGSKIESQHSSSIRITTLHALHYLISRQNSLAAEMLREVGVELSHIDRELGRCDITSLVPSRSNRELKREEHPLEKFGTDMLRLAREGAIDPVIGREREIERVVEILARRKKSNPLLIGEAGVGKSAIVEGLALMLASGELFSRELFSLDVGALVAGTKFRGEFEERMQQLLEAITASRGAIIFIDEIHTIVGAGSSNGSLDIANILKPAMARGDVQIIGATTIAEYRRDIETDAALDRRFCRVMVEPTSREASIKILTRLSESYGEHHSVSYSPEALEAAVDLSLRYMPDRHLPDKAIDIMDELGARFHGERISPEHVSRLITSITGIPEGQLAGSERERLRGLERHLRSRIIGQSEAIERVARAIYRSRCGLRGGGSPIGVFLFVGATGVGKTLLAKELAHSLFEGERSLVRIDMSEYNQPHSISRLIGSPPGYVGYGSSGELSEAVRRHPYSVVLLDEIEKAHGDIYNLMLQLFDEGHLTDGSGRKVDFSNTIIIMTSNIGSLSRTPHRAMGYNAPSEGETHARDKEIERHFSPEFLGRVDDIIHFRSLEERDIETILLLELDTIAERLSSLGYTLSVSRGAQRTLTKLGSEGRYGAREIRRIITEHLEDPLSRLLIDGNLTDGDRLILERKRGSRGVVLRVA